MFGGKEGKQTSRTEWIQETDHVRNIAYNIQPAARNQSTWQQRHTFRGTWLV